MEDYFEQIEAYLQDQLSPVDRAAFEAAMGKDSSLRVAVDNYDYAKLLSEGLLELDVIATLESLSEQRSAQVMRQVEKKSSSRSSVLGKKACVLLVFVALLIVAWLLNMNADKCTIELQDKEALYAEFYRPPINEVGERGAEVQYSNLEMGILLYHAGQYEEAKVQFASPSVDASSRDFYLGHIAMVQGDYLAAENLFAATQIESGVYYQTLACILAGDYKKAKMVAVNLGDHGIQGKLKALLHQNSK